MGNIFGKVANKLRDSFQDGSVADYAKEFKKEKGIGKEEKIPPDMKNEFIEFMTDKIMSGAKSRGG